MLMINGSENIHPVDTENIHSLDTSKHTSLADNGNIHMYVVVRALSICRSMCVLSLCRSLW